MSAVWSRERRRDEILGIIRITSATLQLPEGYVTVKPLGLVPVKGLTEPIEFEIIGPGAARSSLEAAAARGNPSKVSKFRPPYKRCCRHASIG